MKSKGDHTAPGRQPLSSNPLSDVMTLSNLDHLLKHVPEQSAPCCVKNPTPLPNHRPAAGWLLAARRQGQGHRSQLSAEGDTHASSHTHTRKQSHTHIHVKSYTHIRMQSHTHTRMQSHTHMHSHAHTQTLYEMEARKPPVIQSS